MSAEPIRGEVVPIAQPTAQAITPMDMLDRAVANGAGIDVLTKLMDLQERWERNQARKAFDAAVANAKAELKPVIKTRKGHNGKYEDFAAIANSVDPVLGRFGLSYRFRSAQAERISVTCILSHKDGHSEETTLTGPADTTGNKNAIQAIGSTLTYLQRYSLKAALGLAAAHDDDAKNADPGEVITDKQAEEIRGLVTDSRSNVELFLKWAGAESIPDIRASKYEDAVKFLKAKMQKAKAS